MARENGFDWPLHPLQCLTWALFPTILFDFYFVLMPCLPGPGLRWGSCVVYSAIALVTFVSAWITAAVDPRDPHVARAAGGGGRRGAEDAFADKAGGGDGPGRRRGSRLARCCEPLSLGPLGALGADGSRALAADDTCLCYLCQAHVFASSKHCRFCDKCVLRFDHHCKWLNTCVGSKNYGYFLTVIGSTCAFTALQLALSAYVAFELTAPSRRSSAVARLARRHFLARAFGLKGVTVAVYGYAALLLPLVILIGQLAVFHAMLVEKNLTTYEYILHEQKRELEDLTSERDDSEAESGGGSDGSDASSPAAPPRYVVCTLCTASPPPRPAAADSGDDDDDKGVELARRNEVKPDGGGGGEAPEPRPADDDAKAIAECGEPTDAI